MDRNKQIRVFLDDSRDVIWELDVKRKLKGEYRLVSAEQTENT